MNNYKFIFAFLIFSYTLFAQDYNNGNKIDYNKWSIELNAGQNKPEKPFTSGYFTSDPDKYFNFSGVNHFDIGVRHMFNTTFGAKLDFGYDIMKNASGTISLPFETEQYRIGLQGVVNIGRLLQFESFTKRFSILVHGGLQASRLNPKFNNVNDVNEDSGGLILGITPQFRISNRIVLTGDFSYISNVRQHLTWDGRLSDPANNLSGTLLNTSLGLTFYLGKQEKHADWTFTDEIENDVTDKLAQKRIDDIETLMNDTDKDGVPDYLDSENNTPNGVSVDNKGRFIDTNNNNIPDELEPSSPKDGKNGISVASQQDILRILIEKGYINIFFDVNKDTPNSGSTNNVFYVYIFLSQYPDVKLVLTGYADSRGNEADNQDLSDRRSQNIYDLLVASGIDDSRITIEGKGVDTTYPDSSIGLDLARRVSIKIN
jgi:OOP family OmpA-OmpF porin